MSPEQIRGDDLDSRTDVYGLGIVAFQLLSGHRPYAGDSVATVLHKTLNVMPVRPSSLNPALPHGVDSVIFRSLAKHRDDRYATCEAFANELAQALDGTPPTTYDETVHSQMKTLTHTEVAKRKSGTKKADSLEGSVTIPPFMADKPDKVSSGSKVGLLIAILCLGAAVYFRDRLLPHSQPAVKPPASAPPQARLMTAKRQLQNVIEALSSYAIDHGRYPTGPWGNAYTDLVPAFGAKESMPIRDPWGEAYRYTVTSDGKNYVLLSPGNDGVYQTSESVITRLLTSGCKTEKEVITTDDTTQDIVVCKGRFLTLADTPSGAP
jgi:serine/threonine protein kinase